MAYLDLFSVGGRKAGRALSRLNHTIKHCYEISELNLLGRDRVH